MGFFFSSWEFTALTATQASEVFKDVILSVIAGLQTYYVQHSGGAMIRHQYAFA